MLISRETPPYEALILHYVGMKAPKIDNPDCTSNNLKLGGVGRNERLRKLLSFGVHQLFESGKGVQTKPFEAGCTSKAEKYEKNLIEIDAVGGKYIQIVLFGSRKYSAVKNNALPTSLASRLDVRVYLTHIPSLLMTNKHKERMHSEYFMLTLFYCQPHSSEHFQVSCVTKEGIFRASCLR